VADAKSLCVTENGRREVSRLARSTARSENGSVPMTEEPSSRPSMNDARPPAGGPATTEPK
jgi:hypothetical protein